ACATRSNDGCCGTGAAEGNFLGELVEFPNWILDEATGLNELITQCAIARRKRLAPARACRRAALNDEAVVCFVSGRRGAGSRHGEARLLFLSSRRQRLTEQFESQQGHDQPQLL